MAYHAVISRLTNVREHPNADRLQLATVRGNTVIVGLDQNEGDLGIYFPTDGQLSHEFVNANNLYRRNPDGTKGGGFFDLNRRVRAQPFRGVKSDGFWTGIGALTFVGQKHLYKLEAGDEITELGGTLLCQKYYTPATRRAMAAGQMKKRRENIMFHQHFDTEQWRFNKERVLPSDTMILTEKVHGTSGRYGYVRDELPKRWWERLLGCHFPRYGWEYLMGTRRVIVGEASNPGFYGTDEFRYKAVEKLTDNLHKGEMVYFEIVGWVSETTPIMPPAVTTKVDLPHVTELYGDEFHYNYGCMRGVSKLIVYRISMVNVDGVEIDLSWKQVKARCAELGVEHVTEIVPPGHYDETVVEQAAVGQSLSGDHMREGVCIRVDQGERQPLILKHKSYEFGVLEGYIKQDDNYVDIEEAA
jgi:hypothetical protein